MGISSETQSQQWKCVFKFCKFTKQKQNMNKFTVFLALALSPKALGEPEASAEAHCGGYYGRHRGYGHHGHRAYAAHPVCKTVWDVTHTITKTEYDNVCNTVTETITKTEYDNVCNTISEQVCHPVAKAVPEQQCTTDYVQECVNTPQTIVETSLVEECQDVKTQVCEETALVGVHRNVAVQPIAAPVAHAGIAHSGLTHAGLALPTLTAGLAHPVAGVAATHGLPAPILPTGIHKREA